MTYLQKLQISKLGFQKELSLACLREQIFFPLVYNYTSQEDLIYLCLMYLKIILWSLPNKFSIHENDPRVWPTRMSHEFDPQVWPTRLTRVFDPQEWPTWPTQFSTLQSVKWISYQHNKNYVGQCFSILFSIFAIPLKFEYSFGKQ